MPDEGLRSRRRLNFDVTKLAKCTLLLCRQQWQLLSILIRTASVSCRTELSTRTRSKHISESATEPTGPGPPQFGGYPTTISCYFYVERPGALPLTQMLPQIPVFPGILTRRADAFSITVAGLLLSLRYWQETPVMESSVIKDLITGDFRPLSSVTLSSTRVPDFTSNSGYSCAAAGYRRLTSLLDAEASIEASDVFPGESLSLPKEIIAAATTSNSSSADLFHLWAPMGVEASSLFILIANFHGTSPGSSQQTEPPSPHGSLSHTSSWSSQFSDFSEADAALFLELPREDDFSFAHPQFHASLDPILPGMPVMQAAPVGARKKTRQRSASAARVNKFVKDVCESLGNGATFLDVHYVDGTTLTGKVRQHRAMRLLLQKLDLRGFKAEDFKTFQHPSDGTSLSLRTDTVLTACSWAVQTFKNQGGIYTDLESLATHFLWKGSVPVAG